MPKRVAIIDIGSNSARVVIYQRTSRFGFHLIAQQKANVRISENSFENSGILQEFAMQRAINALIVFKKIIKEYKARKTLIVATAAVRNAPNKFDFLTRVKKATDFQIKVIDGNKEAFYGAIAAKNLLPINNNSISIDIGGGSTDISLIQNQKVIDTISLNIGTLTLKELFFDKNREFKDAISFIKQELKKIPNSYRVNQAIAIGGVLRALAKSIMEIDKYSYKKIHAFEYNIKHYNKHIDNILNAKNYNELEFLYIKENRYDTIKGGVLIFKELLEFLNIENVITSGVGVREGIFLNDMLRGSGGKFPKELNPSIISIKDRLDMLKLNTKKKEKIAKSLYTILEDKIDKNKSYLNEILDAIKISNVGKTLTIYDEHKHSYYIATQELNWQYTHKQMLLIAAIIRSKGDKLIYKNIKKEHKELLPSKKTLKWLGLIYNLSDLLYAHAPNANFKFKKDENSITIESNESLYLLKEDIKTLNLPKKFSLNIIEKL